MPTFKFDQYVQQLEKRKGGYYYLKVDAATVEQFDKKRSTRLKCIIDEKVTFSCGLNHFGDGHYYIILARRNFKVLEKNVGDLVSFEIFEDPNPLGVEMPEVLKVLLEQDDIVKEKFERLTDGKKRTLIYYMLKTKDIDKQVEHCLMFLDQPRIKRK